MRFWLRRCALAITLAALAFAAWRAAIEPIRLSASDVAETSEGVAPSFKLV